MSLLLTTAGCSEIRESGCGEERRRCKRRFPNDAGAGVPG